MTGELDKKMMHKLARLKITSFGKKTYQELKETITNLRDKGAKSFVIDVRQKSWWTARSSRANGQYVFLKKWRNNCSI